MAEAAQPVEARRRGAGKSAAAFRTISEVAGELDVPQHVLRFWESKFIQVKPMKRGGGRRYYRPEDIDLLRSIPRAALYRRLYHQGRSEAVARGRRKGARRAPEQPGPAGRAGAADPARGGPRGAAGPGGRCVRGRGAESRAGRAPARTDPDPPPERARLGTYFDSLTGGKARDISSIMPGPWRTGLGQARIIGRDSSEPSNRASPCHSPAGALQGRMRQCAVAERR